MILTVNRDKLFDSEKPPGARSHIFRLTYEPCNFDKAVEYYNEWNEELKRDWWWTFSKKRNYGFEPDVDVSDIDKKPKKGRKRKRSDKSNNSKIIKINEEDISKNTSNDNSKKNASNKITDDNNTLNSEENKKNDYYSDDINKNDSEEDCDDEFIPKSLEDIVEVRESTVRIIY